MVQPKQAESLINSALTGLTGEQVCGTAAARNNQRCSASEPEKLLQPHFKTSDINGQRVGAKFKLRGEGGHQDTRKWLATRSS